MKQANNKWTYCYILAVLRSINEDAIVLAYPGLGSTANVKTKLQSAKRKPVARAKRKRTND